MLSPSDINGIRQLTDLGNPAATADGAAAAGPKSVSIDQYEVEHLDYGYVRQCTDVDELHVLLAVLRSGKEGLYPELETFMEGRIQSLGGKLLGSRPAPTSEPTDVRNDVADDLDNWLQSIPSVHTKPAPTTSHDLASSADSSTEPTTDPFEQELLLESANQSNLKGHEALRSHDYAEAIDHYRAAMSLIPTDPRFSSNCALAHNKAGEYEKAAVCAQDALKLNPQPPLAYKCYMRLAIARFNQKRWKNALEALEQCTRLAPVANDAKDHEQWIAKAKAKWRELDFEAYRAWAEQVARGSKGKKLKIVVVESDD